MKKMAFFLLVSSFLGATHAVWAEDVTVSTYYPSPYGNYRQLDSTGNTTLSTDANLTATTGIGAINANYKLHISAPSVGSAIGLTAGGPAGPLKLAPYVDEPGTANDGYYAYAVYA